MRQFSKRLIGCGTRQRQRRKATASARYVVPAFIVESMSAEAWAIGSFKCDRRCGARHS